MKNYGHSLASLRTEVTDKEIGTLPKRDHMTKTHTCLDRKLS
ncbi:MAG: hypothetical protein ACJAWK_000321 [Candidatus Azotimanducaceae bacterium]|jgi:hypothetical protein